MKNIVLFYLLFVISAVSHGERVSSRASAAADVDGLSIEHRPIKLFQCWSGPDESTSFRFPYCSRVLSSKFKRPKPQQFHTAIPTFYNK